MAVLSGRRCESHCEICRLNDNSTGVVNTTSKCVETDTVQTEMHWCLSQRTTRTQQEAHCALKECDRIFATEMGESSQTTET